MFAFGAFSRKRAGKWEKGVRESFNKVFGILRGEKNRETMSRLVEINYLSKFWKPSRGERKRARIWKKLSSLRYWLEWKREVSFFDRCDNTVKPRPTYKTRTFAAWKAGCYFEIYERDFTISEKIVNVWGIFFF